VIPTYNSARFLGDCIKSIRNQSWKNIEVIVVDDGSTDCTVDIAEKYKCRVIRNPIKGRAEAKNVGIKNSCGEYLFFVDSDMELTFDVVAQCLKLALGDAEAVGIVIPERSVGRSFWVKIRNFERSFYSGSMVESARFFKADPIKEVGGFDENLVFFEESTLPNKLLNKGFNVFSRVESAILHHEEDFSISIWLRKKFIYGKTLETYRQSYSAFSRLQTGVLSRLDLFFKERQRFFGKPKLALGVIVLKSLEYSATGLGLIYSKFGP
jgi:glycosyltransferase involved in cell wall biosynthesis